MVTCFLTRRDEDDSERVLLLRRSRRVGTYRGRWAGVSGYLEAPDPLAQAYRELREETGLPRDDVRLLAAGDPLAVDDESLGVRWVVHPFLFRLLPGREPVLDWEHTESRWVASSQMGRFKTVPALREALDRVYRGRDSGAGRAGSSARGGAARRGAEEAGPGGAWQ